MPRDRLDLCGVWRFQPDPSGEGERAGYHQPGYDDRLWREARLPNGFEACAPGLDTYEGAGWFRRSVVVPEAWEGRRVALCFQGVNYHAKVWVNGYEVGVHDDGFLPFELEVRDRVRYGGANVVAVCADNTRLEGQVPGMQRGWRTFGGILREVELVATAPCYLDRVAVVAEPLSGGGSLSVSAKVGGEWCHRTPLELYVQVSAVEGDRLVTLASGPAVPAPGEEAILSVEGQVVGARPWSPKEPNLYLASVTLCRAGQPIDERQIHVGFRRAEARDGRLWLNGEPIYLTGFNRHEDSPQHNMATDLATARRDLEDMKAAGANFVRLCHYPHHPGEIDLCDELGLLAMGEIPLYWWDGDQEGEEWCAAKLAAARRQLEAMIRRDVNHPSIVFWSVSNETQEQRPEVADGNRQLVRLARALDPTRLAVHVSDKWRGQSRFEDDDVICVNGYPSLDRRGFRGELDYDLSESTRFWREGLEALHSRYPGKPILVTEFGYASLQGVYGNGLGEDVQAQAIEAEFAGMQAPYVCGATVWCWADHAWPPATFAYCSYLSVSPYGVVSRDRKKLKAYRTVQRMFREKQGIPEPRRPAPPRMGMAGYEVTMIRPDMRDVPQVPFPEGFSIRPMRLDEGGLWTDIERDAEPHFPIADDTFWREFGSDLQAIQWRSFVVTNPRGAGVGTISAWRNPDFRGRDYGMIHWVAIRPAYQGVGLGRAALSFALNRLAQWHDCCLLGTQTKRLRAIRLYLNFGFRPDLEEPGAIEAWRHVKSQLQHPGLDVVP